MSDLAIFRYEGADVRTVRIDGEPWFVLADVCNVLHITNSRNVAARLDEDDKVIHPVDTPGGRQNVFEVVERTVQHPDKAARIRMTPKVTGKGQAYFLGRYTTPKAAAS